MNDAVADLDPHVRAGWTPRGAADAGLPAHAAAWLTGRIGPTSGATPVAADSTLAVPEPALSASVLAALVEAVGPRHVLTDRAARLARAGGLSYLDLMRRRGAGEPPVPDAVVCPADPAQVQRVVSLCAEHGVGLVPFGGGTSVVGGVQALRGGHGAVLVLDLVRLNRLVAVDAVSRLAVLQAGLTAPAADRLLAAHGLTVGHVPQSYERATIGGFAATRSSGQQSAGYGRFEDMVEGLRLSTPRGELRLGVAPASAAGPDLKQLVVGSEGAFGVITEVTLRVRPLPVAERHEGFVVDGWAAGQDLVRELAQARVAADVTRLSDPAETEVGLRLRGGLTGALLRRYLAARGIADPCLLILGWHGATGEELAVRRSATLRVMRGHRVVRLGRRAGEAWRHGRFAGPRQRDALMDAGVCVETLETAGYWSRLSALRDAVRAALTEELTGPGRTPVVGCHISHSYETGASLYFTVLVPRDVSDPIGQWRRAKAAACAAIGSSDRDGPLGHDGPLGTISHHHAVGVDHAPYLPAEVGALGVDVLRAVKRELDPTGVLNPGKLIS